MDLTILIRSEYIPHSAGIGISAVVHVAVQVIFQVPKIVLFLLEKKMHSSIKTY